MFQFKTKKTILDIRPYVPGESKSDSTERLVKLSSNEGAFGPSPKAVKAMQEAATNMHRYPDGDANILRDAIAKKNNIDKKNIICGAGSDEIIMFLCQAFAGEGDEVLHSEHGFLMYSIYAKAAGATPVSAPEKDLIADPQALLDKVTDKTRLIFLANPNNPTGTYWTRQTVVDFHTRLPKNVILVLDSAYAEFVDDPDYTAGHDLVKQHNNIVVTRTFSKLYGLGGVRLGWGHASDEIIDILNRIRGPFNANRCAQAAGVAALNDDEFVQQSIEHNKKMLDWVSAELISLGLDVVPSQGNFVIVDFGDEERAEGCRLYLKEQNIFVRQIGGYGLPTYLRISIGLEDEMKLALEAICAYLSK
ncbi:MAG: histidinol-phosphate transaminase [Micavibrio sp.]|nr:histidinol-phosphate transaminase [Micavibrio sp.]